MVSTIDGRQTNRNPDAPVALLRLSDAHAQAVESLLPDRLEDGQQLSAATDHVRPAGVARVADGYLPPSQRGQLHTVPAGIAVAALYPGSGGKYGGWRTGGDLCHVHLSRTLRAAVRAALLGFAAGRPQIYLASVRASVHDVCDCDEWGIPVNHPPCCAGHRWVRDVPTTEVTVG